MSIVVFGAVFVDIKGYPLDQYIPGGRNVGRILQVHGGVSRNIAEDIANVKLAPVYVSVVDKSGIQRTDDGLGTWLAIFDNQGDVVAAISKRPDLSPIDSVLEEHGDEIFREADSIVVEIDMEKPLLKKIFALAEKYHKEVFAVVSNISIVLERRELLQKTGCVVCNEQEAGLLFSDEYQKMTPEELLPVIKNNAEQARIPRLVVTLGEKGSVYTELNGESGFCPPRNVDVIDTTGAGDAFFAGVTIGLTYGKNLKESCEIGTRLAASTIATKDNVCPIFRPEEFGLVH